MVITLKGCASHTTTKKTTNSLSIIQFKVDSDDRGRGPRGAYITDGSGGVKKRGSKAQALVADLSGSRGGG